MGASDGAAPDRRLAANRRGTEVGTARPRL